MNKTEKNRSIKKISFEFIKKPEIPIIFFILLLIIFLSINAQHFFTLRNFIKLSRQISILGIVSIGMTLAILSGGIDLSVGSIVGLSISIAGTFVSIGCSFVIVFLITLTIGFLCGILNGWLIHKLMLPPIIVTLGTMNIFRGIAFVYTQGYWVTGIPLSYLKIGKDLFPITLCIFMFIIIYIIMSKTKYGRHVYAIGGDENSARLAGINLKRVKIATYTISGLLAAFAGMIFIGRTGVIQPTAGAGYEMQAIAAATIGGVSITGGKGTMLGTFLGIILLGILLNGLTLMKVSAYWQGAATGILIIFALLFDSLRTNLF